MLIFALALSPEELQEVIKIHRFLLTLKQPHVEDAIVGSIILARNGATDDIIQTFVTCSKRSLPITTKLSEILPELVDNVPFVWRLVEV
jgi:hypothetical protein